MATRFIAKHGLKSNINRLTLSEGEIAIAYSDDKSEAEIYVGGNDNTPIPAAGASMKTKNQIFVVCDGDHDELKLQAAISTAPYNSVIYPVGTKCVLTNENTIRGYGLPESSGRAIISLKGSMTLDGSMCDDFIFKNTNPAEKQHIFHIPQSTTMKNVKFEEDIKTVTSDTINPIVLFAETESEIVSCSFVNIFSTHQLGVSTFKLGKVLFFNNVINGFEGAPGNVITREISIANYAKIIGNEFLDFTHAS